MKQKKQKPASNRTSIIVLIVGAGFVGLSMLTGPPDNTVTAGAGVAGVQVPVTRSDAPTQTLILRADPTTTVTGDSFGWGRPHTPRRPRPHTRHDRRNA